ncbi:MAG: VOC family protein [Oligoflexales bacterium]
MAGPLSDSEFGGILLFCNDFPLMQDFYRDKLGLNVDQCGASCASFNANGLAVTLRPAKLEQSTSPRKHLLIGFNVKDIGATREQLVAKGVKVSDVQVFGFGKVAELIDPEGNVIALEEPRKN